MLQFQLLEPEDIELAFVSTPPRLANLLFALGVEVDATDFPLHLVEADIVEPLEAGTCYSTHAMIRHQKVFFPSHENILPLGNIPNHNMALTRLLLEGPEGIKFAPMAQVDLAVSAPALILSKETVFRPDNLSLKVCSEGWVVFGQSWKLVLILTYLRDPAGRPTLYAQVTTEKGFPQIDVLNLNLDVVDLSL